MKGQNWLIPVGLFGCALLIRLAALALWPFDGLYGQDAFVYFGQAAAILERVPQGQLPPTDIYWPNGYPAVVALGMALFGKEAWVAQGISLLAGAGLSPLVFALTNALFPDNRPGSVVAGLIVACAGQMVLSSLLVMSDMAALFWLVLAAWLLVRGSTAEFPSTWYAATGAAFGVALVSRWLSGLAAPALIVYALLTARHRNEMPRAWLAGAAVAALIVLPQLWLSLRRPEGLFHSWLLGWHPANAFQREFMTGDGYFLFELPVALFNLHPAVHPAYLTPLMGFAALWATLRLLAERDWLPLVLLVGWAGTAYLFLAGIPYENFRYGLTMFPPLVALAGIGTAYLWRDLRQPTLVAVLVVSALVVMLGWTYRMVGSFLETQNQSKALVSSVSAKLPPDATLMTLGPTATMDHYTSVSVEEFFLLSPAEIEYLVAREQPLYLLLDTIDARYHWRGHPPDTNLTWLEKYSRLEEIDSFPPYTLFRVHSLDSRP